MLRRLFVAGLGMLCGLGATPALAAPERARPADAFVDTVGVNLHLHHQGTVYDTRFEQVIRPKLIASGIRHVRDGAATHAEAGPEFFYYRRCRALAEAGIRFDMLTTFPTAISAGTDYEKLAAVNRWCGGAVESFEGVNEPDLQPLPAGVDWRTETIASQERLHRAVRGNAAIRDIPVLGPTVVWSPHDVGDLSAYLDYGNWHPYPGGECPTCGDVYGQNIETYLPRYRAPSGAKPMVMTETGYHNAVSMPFAEGLHRPASELSAAKYHPRLLLEYFNRGFVRTYIYELIDAAPDPARQNPEANFGLLRNDGSEKPAYRAVSSLLRLLGDPGPAFTPGPLDYTLDGQLSGVHHTLLQKRDGRFFLALWLERSSYDTGARPHAPDDVGARRDLAVPEQPVTIALADPRERATVHRLDERGTLRSQPATFRQGSIDLSLADRVTVVELPSRGSAGAGNRAPQLRRVRLSRRAFPARTRRGRRGGSRLRYTLSERATVAIAIERRGRVVGSLHARKRSGRRSTLISGRVRRRALPRGRYRLRVRARDAVGAWSATHTVRFRIVTRR
jgi:hypothetical protein